MAAISHKRQEYMKKRCRGGVKEQIYLGDPCYQNFLALFMLSAIVHLQSEEIKYGFDRIVSESVEF